MSSSLLSGMESFFSPLNTTSVCINTACHESFVCHTKEVERSWRFGWMLAVCTTSSMTVRNTGPRRTAWILGCKRSYLVFPRSSQSHLFFTLGLAAWCLALLLGWGWWLWRQLLLVMTLLVTWGREICLPALGGLRLLHCRTKLQWAQNLIPCKSLTPSGTLWSIQRCVVRGKLKMSGFLITKLSVLKLHQEHSRKAQQCRVCRGPAWIWRPCLHRSSRSLLMSEGCFRTSRKSCYFCLFFGLLIFLLFPLCFCET